MSERQDRDFMLQEDFIAFVKERLGQEQWVTVYLETENGSESIGLFSALVPEGLRDTILKTQSWDLSRGDGKPGFMTKFGRDGSEVTTYLRFGNAYGIEPLILYRSFWGARTPYLEVSEEFRLYHDLCYEPKRNAFIRIDDNGDEEDVILIKPNSVKIKLRFLKEFLAARNMLLVLYFESDRYSEKTLTELGLENGTREVREEATTFALSMDDLRWAVDKERRAISSLSGKKLVQGAEPNKQVKTYEEFIVDVDKDGQPVFDTCNPEALANFFGKNPGAPHYLTSVFFSRDVLGKYYSEPSKYMVQDGLIMCHRLWSLRVDNNHDKFVVVYLGDLGHLAHKEQAYWKSYNVPPEGKMSFVNYSRSVLGQFTEPRSSDLVFKSTFAAFNRRWQAAFGWPLFKPLPKQDEHNLTALHVPLVNDQAEFDKQVMSLGKVLIDSLNEPKLEEYYVDKKEGDKGISKLVKFLTSRGLTDHGPYITFLRSLWDLRIGAGHLKGEKYERGCSYFGIGKRNLIDVFTDILIDATGLLIFLDDRLLWPG